MANSPKLNAIILAAGKGTRMKSDRLKVLHHVAGKPILAYVIEAVSTIASKSFVVVGHQADDVKTQFKSYDCEFVEQPQQLGTGHAVQQVIPYINNKEQSHTIILAGDCPLIQESTLRSLLNHHNQSNSAATILTTHMPNPQGYGRMLRSKNGSVIGIKEHKDCNEKELAITEINSGIYVFNTSLLLSYILELQSNNSQQEYYLTDIIHILKEKNHLISAVVTPDHQEIIGINTRNDLAKSNKVIFNRNNQTHMKNGVTLIDPDTTFIDSSVSIKQDTIIHPFSIISGNTTIGTHCNIGPFVEILDQTIDNNQHIK